MDTRKNDLTELQSYIENTNKEITMILQSLQWDQKHLLEQTPLVPCRYDANHRIPLDKKECHEKECLLRTEGYTKDDKFLPDPLDPGASTVVKLCKEDVRNIINYVSQSDPTFQRGSGSEGPVPLTAERMQATYTADERRAIHDAVTCATPLGHIVGDLAMPTAKIEAQESLRKSRLQLLAELRDMKRRRVKYRGGDGGRYNNFSHVLRDLIKAQMEIYTGVNTDDGDTNVVKSEKQDRTEQQRPYGTNNDRFIVKREKVSESRERSDSVDNKRIDREKHHRDDDRHSRYHSRKDDRSQTNKYETRREYEREDRRDYHDKRRDRERDSRRPTKSKNYNEYKRDRR